MSYVVGRTPGRTVVKNAALYEVPQQAAVRRGTVVRPAQVGTAVTAPVPFTHGPISLYDYNTYDQVQDYLEWLDKSYPFCKLVRIGSTARGKALTAIKIGQDLPTHAVKRSVWVDAGIGDKDWTGTSGALQLIYRIVKSINDSELPLVETLRDYNFCILPIADPDNYTHGKNFDAVYQAPQETVVSSVQPLRQVLWRLKDAFGAALSLHGPGLVTRQGQVRGPLPEEAGVWGVPLEGADGQAVWDVSDLRAGAEAAVQAIKQRSGRLVRVLNTRDIYGLTPQNNMSDWLKSVAGVKYAYRVNLVPEQRSQQVYRLPHASQRVLVGDELTHALKSLLVFSRARQSEYTLGKRVAPPYVGIQSNQPRYRSDQVPATYPPLNPQCKKLTVVRRQQGNHGNQVMYYDQTCIHGNQVLDDPYGANGDQVVVPGNEVVVPGNHIVVPSNQVVVPGNEVLLPGEEGVLVEEDPGYIEGQAVVLDPQGGGQMVEVVPGEQVLMTEQLSPIPVEQQVTSYGETVFL